MMAFLAAIVAILAFYFTYPQKIQPAFDFISSLLTNPIFLWGLLFAILLSLVILKVKQPKKSGPISFTIPAHGWREIDVYNFNDVVWPIRVQNDPFGLGRWDKSILRIDVDKPRCPKCNADLEEKEPKTFLGKYLWTCIGCGFYKKNKESFHTESKRVENLYNRDLRQS